MGKRIHSGRSADPFGFTLQAPHNESLTSATTGCIRTVHLCLPLHVRVISTKPHNRHLQRTLSLGLSSKCTVTEGSPHWHSHTTGGGVGVFCLFGLLPGGLPWSSSSSSSSGSSRFRPSSSAFLKRCLTGFFTASFRFGSCVSDVLPHSFPRAIHDVARLFTAPASSTLGRASPCTPT